MFNATKKTLFHSKCIDPRVIHRRVTGWIPNRQPPNKIL